MKGRTSKAKIGITILTIVGFTMVAVAANYNQVWPKCDGVEITTRCQDEEGKKYEKYIYHPPIPEKTKEVYHAAVPAKTHTVTHPPQYGTRTVRDCIRTNISYKNGTCARSRCRDGSYSGSSGWGTCNYHGGVAQTGGPWYTYREERYLIKEGWTETVVDEPEKPAWTETVIIQEARDEWIEKELIK